MNNLKEKYKIKELKRTVLSLIQEKNMFSIMNNTKWTELQKSIAALPFPPPYQIKFVTDIDEPEPFDEDVWYQGNWDDEALLPFFNIEWLKVRPRYIKTKGSLSSRKIVDESNLFLAILKKYSIPYEKKDKTFTILGYKKIQ